MVAGVVVALSGCSLAEDPVLTRFEHRAPLPSCGSISLDQGQLLEDQTEALECLADALTSGAGAELSVQQPTTEGDPITSFYRVLTDGSTEVYVDSTQDEYSDRTWSHSTCAKPTSVLDVNC